MKSPFDDAKLSLRCPACGKTTKRSLGQLQANKNVKCSGCGRLIEVKGASGLDKIGKAVDAFRATTKKLDKR